MTLGALETHDVVGFAFSSLLSCPSVSFPSLSEHGWRHCKSSIRRFATLCHYSSVLCPELSYTLFLFFGIVPFVIFTLSLFFGLVPFYVCILRTFGCTYLWDGLGLGWGFGFVLVFFLKVFLNVWAQASKRLKVFLNVWAHTSKRLKVVLNVWAWPAKRLNKLLKVWVQTSKRSKVLLNV